MGYDSYNPTYEWNKYTNTVNQKRIVSNTPWTALDEINRARYAMNASRLAAVRALEQDAERKREFETSMSETKRQHDDNVRLKEEEISANKTAATYSGVIQTGLLAYGLADKAGLFSKTASTAKTTADGVNAAKPAVDVGSQAAVGSSGAAVGAGSSAVSAGTAGGVQQTTMGGQQIMTNSSGNMVGGNAPAIAGTSQGAVVSSGAPTLESILGSQTAGDYVAEAGIGYAAGGIAAKQQPIREYGRWARFGIGKGQKADEQAAGFHGGTWLGAAYGYIAGGPWGALVGGVIGGIAGAVGCFVAGTKIVMSDLSEKNVEDINIGDTMLEGGKVYGKGQVLESGLFEYRGKVVAGTHAVLENGEWIRIKDSIYATELEGEVIVYPIVNERHIMIVDGMVFADMQETNHGTNVNDDYRIWYLNLEKERNSYLDERYPNSTIHGSVLHGACKNMEVLRVEPLPKRTSA